MTESMETVPHFRVKSSCLLYWRCRNWGRVSKSKMRYEIALMEKHFEMNSRFNRMSMKRVQAKVQFGNSSRYL